LHPPAILATWIARGPAVQQGSDAARSSAMERRARWLNRSTPKAAPQPAGRALTSVMRATVCSSTLDYTREKRWLCPRGGVERPGRVVRFVRLIVRPVRVLADLRSAPRSRAVCAYPGYYPGWCA
jgi:hypothetical protein